MNLSAEPSPVLSRLLARNTAAAVRGVLRRAAHVVSSDPTAVESERALRRLVAGGELTEVDAAERRGARSRASSSWTSLRIGADVIERARGTFAAEPVGTPDALHLASALVALPALPRMVLLSLDDRVRRNGAALGPTVLP